MANPCNSGTCLFASPSARSWPWPDWRHWRHCSLLKPSPACGEKDARQLARLELPLLPARSLRRRRFEVGQVAANGEQGPDRKIEGNIGRPRLDFGDSGLAGFQFPGEPLLGNAVLFAQLTHFPADGQPQLDQAVFLFAQTQEVRGISD